MQSMIRFGVLIILLMLLNTIIAQQINTVHIDGERYFISSQSPYSKPLNWFLASGYCRSIGLELLTLDNLEKARQLGDHLKNTESDLNDYWTSGFQAGDSMFLWLSNGRQFNTTFDMWGQGRKPFRKGPQSCLSIDKSFWRINDCMAEKHFICQRSRCYFVNFVPNRTGFQQNDSINKPQQLPPLNTRRRPSFQNSHLAIRKNSSAINIKNIPITFPKDHEFEKEKISQAPSSNIKDTPISIINKKKVEEKTNSSSFFTKNPEEKLENFDKTMPSHTSVPKEETKATSPLEPSKLLTHLSLPIAQKQNLEISATDNGDTLLNNHEPISRNEIIPEMLAKLPPNKIPVPAELSAVLIPPLQDETPFQVKRSYARELGRRASFKFALIDGHGV